MSNQGTTESLLDLSDDNILQILSTVPIVDVVNQIRRTCKRLRRLSSDPNLTKKVYIYTEHAIPTSTICNFVDQLSQVRTFQFCGKVPEDIIGSALIVSLWKHKDSLEEFSLMTCGVTNGGELLNLINNCSKLKTLKLQSVQCDSFSKAIRENDLQSMPSVQNIVIREVPTLCCEVMKKLIDSFVNLTNVVLYSFLWDEPGKTADYLIQERGPQLKSLLYDETRQDDSLVTLSLCERLEVLTIRLMYSCQDDPALPTLPNVRTLVLDVVKQHAKVLKYFPNLTGLAIKHCFTYTKETIQSITSCEKLTNLMIDFKLNKEDLLEIFTKCKLIQMASILDSSVLNMSEQEIKDCFGRLHAINLIKSTSEVQITVGNAITNYLPHLVVCLHIGSLGCSQFYVWEDTANF